MNPGERAAKLGWIGMGNIGTPMVLRLIAAGHDVTVWGRTKTRLRPALAAGAREARSAQDLAARCEAVFLCVLDDAAVEAVVFGAGGVAAGATAGTVVIDHSTIHPQSTIEFARRIPPSLAWVDAPVSGGAGGAEQGSLSAFLGGDPETVARVRPWLGAYARNVTHVGPIGSGQTAKACNQAVVCATVAVWAEALTLARDCGLDPSVLVEALAGGWADSRVRGALAAGMAEHNSPVRSLGIFLKDLDIVADVARSPRSPTFVSALVSSLFRSAERTGGSGGLNGLMDLYSRGER